MKINTVNEIDRKKLYYYVKGMQTKKGYFVGFNDVDENAVFSKGSNSFVLSIFWRDNGDGQIFDNLYDSKEEATKQVLEWLGSESEYLKRQIAKK